MGDGSGAARGAAPVWRRRGAAAAALALLAGGCSSSWVLAPIEPGADVEIVSPLTAALPVESRLCAAAATTYSDGLRSAGPRFGLIHVGGKAADSLARDYEAEPMLTAWGWQFEYQYESVAGGPTGLVEFVPMLAGMEQGLSIPSVNVLFGMRTTSSYEFAVGPNLSPVSEPDADGDGDPEVSLGVGLTVAVGRTIRLGDMNLPINFAYVGNGEGNRFSITFGWNLRQ